MKQAKLNQIQTNYDCIICMDLSKKPVSCLRCHKLVCSHHLRLLGGKCPHCRLEPFQYQPETLIQSFIQLEMRKKREEQKKNRIFKCLVEGCQFEGKYPAMIFHKKGRHPKENIDEILFQQQRQKKRMRDALKQIFLQKYVEKSKIYTRDALQIYVKTRGAVQLKKLISMVAHVDNCQHHHCKQVFFQQNNIFIGHTENEVKIQSECLQGAAMRLMI